MSIATATQSDETTGRTALLGISTPLAGISMPAGVTGSVVAIVNARLGTLAVDTAAGAVVHGNGSTLLWISGMAAQVNAKLASLAYAGTVAGADDLSLLVLAADGTLTSASQSTIAVVPSASNATSANTLVYIDTGTLTLESRVLNGPNVSLRASDGSPTSPACVLVNSTIGAQSELSVRNDRTGGPMPRVALAGRVELDGTMMFAGSGALVSLAQGATFLNEGTIAISAHAAQFIGAGALINDGLITLTGDGTAGALPRIDASLSGSGTVALTASATLEIGGSVGASETIRLGAGGNIVHLAQPASFAGLIAGFSRADLLVLDSARVTTAYASTAAEAGTTVVTLFDGASLVGTLRFSAPEPGAVFCLAADAAGNPTLSLASVGGPAAPASIDVFRFFDAAHGTQLLTQDRAERDAIVASRPDLHYEGVGLHALDPAHPGADAAPIYRFFDTSSGTHVLTASAAERDQILGTRPDLVFEPNSTLLEHVTPHAGDTPVYRFFDSQSGAHFFTADPGERASILATRPDMTLEGIAFYAPAA